MPATDSIQVSLSGQTRLLVGGMREPLRDYRRLISPAFSAVPLQITSRLL